MSIISLPYLYTQLGLTSGDDGRYSQFLVQAEAVAKNFTRRSLESASAVEYYGGDGTDALILRRRPVTLLESVYEDCGGYFGSPTGAFAAASLLTSGVDYSLRLDEGTTSTSGIIYRINGFWANRQSTRGNNLSVSNLNSIGNIKVTYTAGYTDKTMPEDLKMSVCNIVAAIASNATSGIPYSSENFEYYSYTSATDVELALRMESSRNVLKRYREVVF